MQHGAWRMASMCRHWTADGVCHQRGYAVQQRLNTQQRWRLQAAAQAPGWDVRHWTHRRPQLHTQRHMASHPALLAAAVLRGMCHCTWGCTRLPGGLAACAVRGELRRSNARAAPRAIDGSQFAQCSDSAPVRRGLPKMARVSVGCGSEACLLPRLRVAERQGQDASTEARTMEPAGRQVRSENEQDAVNGNIQGYQHA
mmetsp:Transcript_40368/g.120419  ORF Transcript_40368/g.120419 Transcript_40368/m.120419 type:complete len:199 (-) Transcript_40368:65-661(-)|eukprot:365707-Chlamydomonas_euryale.AAC.2